MVALIPQTRIAELNIDTVERAVVFGYVALYFATGQGNEDNPLTNRIRLDIVPAVNEGINLSIRARLSIDAQDFLSSGGGLISSIKPFEVEGIDLTNSFDFSIDATNPTISGSPSFPVTLAQNFETYSYYYTAILANSLTENRNRIVTINPRRNTTDGQFIEVNLTLPLDTERWFTGQNLIDSVQQLVTEYRTELTFEPETVILGEIDQDTPLGNDELLGN